MFRNWESAPVFPLLVPQVAPTSPGIKTKGLLIPPRCGKGASSLPLPSAHGSNHEGSPAGPEAGWSLALPQDLCTYTPFHLELSSRRAGSLTSSRFCSEAPSVGKPSPISTFQISTPSPTDLNSHPDFIFLHTSNF